MRAHCTLKACAFVQSVAYSYTHCMRHVKPSCSPKCRILVLSIRLYSNHYVILILYMIHPLLIHRGQVKTVRDFDDETRRKSHSKSDLAPFSMAENGWARTDGDKPLKSGWLKKQGGMRKTWSDRWFVLTKKCLYFYKDRDEAKLCVSL